MSTSFGPYEVLERVAEGATGVVYRVRHIELDRVAAVKELSPALREVPGQLARMQHEAEVLARLDSPHIVEVYDYVQESERAWIAEQWVSGASLRDILSSHGRLTPEQSVGVVRGALMGLAYAHERGLVHRDFSPGNVLADMSGTSMLVDFGLAAPVGDAAALGTPAYISPEAVRGEPVGRSSDVYSVAAVLYELLTGRVPFPASDVPTALRRHLEEPAPTLQGFGTDLQALLSRSMDKDPAARPADAAAFLTELEAAAERRFGAGWAKRASIAGIVGSVAATSATAVVGTGAAPVVTGAAQTVVIDSAGIATGVRDISKSAAKTFHGPVVAGVAGIVVVVGIAATAIAVNHGGNDSSPTAGGSSSLNPTATSSSLGPSSTAPTTTPRSSAPPPTVGDLAPAGVYVFKQVLLSSDFPADKVGTATQRTWTFDPRHCGDTQCSARIQSSSGLVLTSTWNGKTLVLDKLEPQVSEGLCSNIETGVKVQGSHYKATRTFQNSPLRAVVGGSGATSAPTRFIGTQTIKEVTTELSKGCHDRDGVNHAKLSVSLTVKKG